MNNYDFILKLFWPAVGDLLMIFLAQPHFFTLCFYKKKKNSTIFGFLDILTKPKACITHSTAILT